MGTVKDAKPWPCVGCGKNLGYVLYGQLLVDETTTCRRFNTDGNTIVLYCGECGTRKIWYMNDRMSRLVSELAKSISNELSRS